DGWASALGPPPARRARRHVPRRQPTVRAGSRLGVPRPGPGAARRREAARGTRLRARGPRGAARGRSAPPPPQRGDRRGAPPLPPLLRDRPRRARRRGSRRLPPPPGHHGVPEPVGHPEERALLRRPAPVPPRALGGRARGAAAEGGVLPLQPRTARL